MRQRKNPLFTHCPICGLGEINQRYNKFLFFTRRQVLPCPSCGAVIAPFGPSTYRLNYCAPHKLGRQGCRRCAGYFYSMCFLDRSLDDSDWERMAQRKPPVEVEEYLTRSRNLESGELPVIEAASLPGGLAAGEVVHHISEPVFTDDQVLPGTPAANEGKLFVTNRRLLYCTAKTCETLPFEDVEDLEIAHPGFYVKRHGEQGIHYFFPPSLDPVFSAVVGALRKFRRTGANKQQS